jgi:voltage-gated potassium channel
VADVAAIVSFLAPVVGEGIGFLRILRTLRLLRTYQLLARLRTDSVFFRRNEDLIIAAVNLGVFIFIMTGFVYETQRWTNTKIGNYIDALYFTIAALTTTGFGDITLTGTLGHLISVAIMIFGVTLFLRLVQVLLRPDKVRFACPVCALQRHDRDAVHCKACGTVLNIPDEGAI